MRSDLYLKIIATVIAVELFLLLLKPTAIRQWADAEDLPAQATQARYNMPNTSHSADEPMRVIIAGVDLPPLKNTSNALPVLTYNPSYFDKGKVKPVALEVKLEGKAN